MQSVVLLVAPPKTEHRKIKYNIYNKHRRNLTTRPTKLILVYSPITTILPGNRLGLFYTYWRPQCPHGVNALKSPKLMVNKEKAQCTAIAVSSNGQGFRWKTLQIQINRNTVVDI